MEKENNGKRSWETPSLIVHGDIATLTLGSPNPSVKTLGFGDDILQVVNQGISTVPQD